MIDVYWVREKEVGDNGDSPINGGQNVFLYSHCHTVMSLMDTKLVGMQLFFIGTPGGPGVYKLGGVDMRCDVNCS